MLFKETIVTWKGLNGPTQTPLVLNTNRVGLFKVRASTKSDFYYSKNPWDRRDKPHFVEATSSVATLITAFDTALDSNVMELVTLPDDDITQTPVPKNIDYEDFAYAYAYEADSDYSWVVYTTKAFGEKRVLVNNSLDELVDIAATGTTTTTSTTSTTSTSTTSTSTSTSTSTTSTSTTGA
ncbi:hypothetical protein LCGC14_1354170 [marine sediment metagenome]|uniref:Uncharacterized protein n=1 Tax=marine sediment metagenome TaxID=412755 RepID=A0A0F9KW39_9ZZZZ